MKYLKRCAIVIAIGFCGLGFQNCAPTNFSGSETNASKTGDVSPASTGTSSQQDPPDVLGEFNFKDILEIDFDGILKVDGDEVELVSKNLLDQDKRAFDSKNTFSVDAGITSTTSCEVKGTNADFSLLEKNVKEIRFATQEANHSVLPDLGSATLTFILKNGSHKQLKIDSKTSAVVVAGQIPLILAPGLYDQLKHVSTHANCSTGFSI